MSKEAVIDQTLKKSYQLPFRVILRVYRMQVASPGPFLIIVVFSKYS